MKKMTCILYVLLLCCKTIGSYASKRTFGNVISHYFKNSYMSAVSALVEEEKISVDELRQLVKQIEEQK